ncbi:hypothetical protein B296_00037564 [Ensete ventricosum]|uniref:Uncharacterized protein n=1 Tax=Ensete ventricosum TaxID=4639 RepID=A0A426XCH4_ENSVE|nr:hypothetical protein B296_00037564 [Ensete ventricosum]
MIKEGCGQPSVAGVHLLLPKKIRDARAAAAAASCWRCFAWVPAISSVAASMVAVGGGPARCLLLLLFKRRQPDAVSSSEDALPRFLHLSSNPPPHPPHPSAMAELPKLSLPQWSSMTMMMITTKERKGKAARGEAEERHELSWLRCTVSHALWWLVFSVSDHDPRVWLRRRWGPAKLP